MDFKLNDDRRMLAETLDRFLRDNYPMDKRHEFAASDAGWSKEMWQQFADLGVIGALFPESSGGFGGEGEDIMVVFEALGRALVVEPFLPTLLAGSLLVDVMGDAANLHIEEVIAGQKIIAFAHGEPGSRYNLDHVETNAEESAGQFALSGHKSVVLSGADADMLIVSARTSGSASGDRGISLFIVDPKSEGVTLRPYGTVDGYPASEVILKNVKATLIGKKDAALEPIEKAHSKAILAMCAESLGAMEVAKDLTVEYMKTRKQFGVIIGKFQALQHRMADVLIEIEQMRSSIVNAAGHLNADRKKREWYVSAAKHMAGTIGRQVAEEAIQIHGGMGMTWEYPVGHYSKRIIMADHLFGDTDHHLERFIRMGE
jgi:alkylation response protein AidB-like acyl-CoA dehydrogenase